VDVKDKVVSNDTVTFFPDMLKAGMVFLRRIEVRRFNRIWSEDSANQPIGILAAGAVGVQSYGGKNGASGGITTTVPT
jgi:hypothetical protein